MLNRKQTQLQKSVGKAHTTNVLTTKLLTLYEIIPLLVSLLYTYTGVSVKSTVLNEGNVVLYIAGAPLPILGTNLGYVGHRFSTGM